MIRPTSDISPISGGAMDGRPFCSGYAIGDIGRVASA
jgi:hypothetical protein